MAALLFRAANSVHTIVRNSYAFGVGLTVQDFVGKITNRRADRVTIGGSVGEVHFSMRPGSSDMEVAYQVLVEQQYGVQPAADVRFIVDAGANIGLTALYLAQVYPRATVIAIEADRGNYELLVENTKGNERIIPRHAALWSTTGVLAVVADSRGDWAFRVTSRAGSVDGPTVEALGLADLIAEYQVERVGYLKLDIEGAEVEVMQSADAWIDKVDTIAVELHDRFRPGCSRSFFEKLRGFPFEFWRGEVLTVSRVPLEGDRAVA